MEIAERRSFQLPKAYDPKQVEDKWYQFWLRGGYFTPPIEPEQKPFVIIMPPPNVTGELHLGHALTATLEDIMTRWHRMRGEPTLWLPGVDHASIAVQNVVEQELAAQGITRHDLGREKFLERVWDWVNKYRGLITQQHQVLGASCDWSRERFTMDEGPSLAVRTTFVNLYHKGLIYRGERIINWCPRCSTALSDLEVDHEDAFSNLWYVRYPLTDGEGDEYITVATTRPETILGDTAVAVNPTDRRFQTLVGRRAILPVLGRRIPIVADEAVDPAFGTGAVKITPGHDPVDFDVAQRHGLPLINIMNPDATLNEEAGPYRGLDRYECRRALLADLERAGLLVKTEPYHHALGHCHRCKTVVEPLASKQWFVKVAPLAERALRAVTEGQIRIVPERFVKVYANWMENIRDWCISRQLWWGHRIPAWYCGRCVELTVTVEEPTACSACGSTDIEQDPDVLDTWFSSALWPHSTLGWPRDTEDRRYFYPTSVMETAYDILFFWVARMIMMGLENTGQVPFHTVYLHGLIRDEQGSKMSKSKGNVVNPVDLMQQYGTDALRFALITGTTPGNDMKLSHQKLEASRNFANKLWNAARFVLSAISALGVQFTTPVSPRLPLEDRWILSRLNRTIATVNKLLGEHQYGEAGRLLHDFTWGEYCDWYIEMAKLRLGRDAVPSPLPVLVHGLEAILRLLHPFMPFITEEIWQNLRLLEGVEKEGDSTLIVARYPEADESAYDDEAERNMALVMEVIRGIRNVRAEFRVEPARWVEAIIVAPQQSAVLQEQATALERLARAQPVNVVPSLAERPKQAMALVLPGAEVFLPWEGMIDLQAEQERTFKEMEACREEIARIQEKLAKADFLAKAPALVVEREREKLAQQQDKLRRLQERMALLS